MASKLLPGRKAVHFHSKVFKRKFLKSQLLKESAMVAADSMMVLEEFERFEEEYSLNDSSGPDHRSEIR